MRLYWRGLNRKFSSNAFLILALTLLHLVAVPVALAVKRMPLLPSVSAALLTIGGLCIVLLMISRGLTMAVQAFFARGDMDLILSSPLSPQSLVTVRTAAIAASLTSEFALLIWPFTNVFLLFGMWGALKGYLLLPAFGLLATSVSLLLALSLFHAFGARRTRVISQVLSACIAIALTVVFQIPNLIARSEGRRPTYGAGAFDRYASTADSGFWTPALVVLHGVVPTLALAAASTLIFWVTTQALSAAFLRASIAAAGVGASVGNKALARGGGLRFIEDTRRIVIRKELRLIARDPWLLSQILQQSLAVLPLAAVAWRQTGSGLPLVWGSLIFVTGNIASALAWLTATAEDAPDLLAASPLSRGYFVRAKLLAALLPIVPIALLPLAFLGRSHTWFGFSVSICAFGSALCCALLNVRERPPAQRRDFRLRHRGGAGRAYLELGVILLWLGICALMSWLGERH